MPVLRKPMNRSAAQGTAVLSAFDEFEIILADLDRGLDEVLSWPTIKQVDYAPITSCQRLGVCADDWRRRCEVDPIPDVQVHQREDLKPAVAAISILQAEHRYESVLENERQRKEDRIRQEIQDAKAAEPHIPPDGNMDRYASASSTSNGYAEAAHPHKPWMEDSVSHVVPERPSPIEEFTELRVHSGTLREVKAMQSKTDSPVVEARRTNATTFTRSRTVPAPVPVNMPARGAWLSSKVARRNDKTDSRTMSSAQSSAKRTGTASSSSSARRSGRDATAAPAPAPRVQKQTATKRDVPSRRDAVPKRIPLPAPRAITRSQTYDPQRPPGVRGGAEPSRSGGATAAPAIDQVRRPVRKLSETQRPTPGRAVPLTAVRSSSTPVNGVRRNIERRRPAPLSGLSLEQARLEHRAGRQALCTPSVFQHMDSLTRDWNSQERRRHPRKPSEFQGARVARKNASPVPPTMMVKRSVNPRTRFSPPSPALVTA